MSDKIDKFAFSLLQLVIRYSVYNMEQFTN